MSYYKQVQRAKYRNMPEPETVRVIEMRDDADWRDRLAFKKSQAANAGRFNALSAMNAWAVRAAA